MSPDPSPAVRISRVDVHDDAALASWHDLVERSERHDHGDLKTVWTLPELTAELRSGRRQVSSAAYVGTVEGRPVVWGMTMLPQLDNLTTADMGVAVPPEERRRGYGSAMARHLEAEAVAAGRSVLTAEAMWPVTASRDGVGQAGVEFAQRHGFTVGNVEVKRVLRCPVPTERLDALAATVAPGHDGYTLRSWTGPVPEDLLESWAVLTSSLTSEAPSGDLHVEPEAADVEAVRENEQLLVAQGRTAYRCVAIATDGAAVGYTELVTTVHEPGRAYQWGTLVHGDHRGHRLGLALKVATQRAVQEAGSGGEDPAGPVDHVLTWNADSNTHMVAVNEALGFEPVEWCGMLQKRL